MSEEIRKKGMARKTCVIKSRPKKRKERERNEINKQTIITIIKDEEE